MNNEKLKIIELKNKIGLHWSIKPNHKINLYLCGPTVYSDVHIGNLRGVILFDLLIRLLKEHKYDFVYYQNITDIDDKIVEQAKKENKSEKNLTNYYTKAYFEILEKLRVLSPKFVIMTDFIPHIIRFIKRLLEINFAYVRSSGVYFDTQKTKYFHPSTDKNFYNNKLKNINKDKKHPYDFVLWKNNLSGKRWASPWGEGRPGWHTECVALIDYFVGVNLNIHGGGSDLFFPHHFNEEAQFKALYPKLKLTDFWLRNAFVSWDDRKLSKSLGLPESFLLAKNFLNKYSANVLRFIFYFVPYEQNVSLQENLLLEAKILENKIKNIFIKVRFQLFLFNKSRSLNTLQEFDLTLWKEFILKLNNNLNTVQAINCLNWVLKKINLSLLNKKYSQTFLFTKTLLKFLHLLGISINLLPINEEIIDKITFWQKAVKEKKYLLADQIRVFLQKKEILI